MRTVVLRAILLSAFLLSVTPGPSYGVSTEEHGLISRDAFLVSLTYAEKNRLISTDEKEALLSCFTRNDEMNYGHLSEIVDDVTDPSKFMKLYGPDVDVGHGVDCSKARAMLLARPITLINKIMASKYNEDHFQEKTLTKFREHNDLAQLYAIRGNLAWALVLNAFAAHYLEDFFAPGHVLTPRTEVNNISARALHDTLNKDGAEISIQTDPELLAHLDIIKEMKLTNGDTEAGVKAITSLNGKYMTLYGDNLVRKSIGQKELMIAEVAKTITSVFKAYKTHELSKFDSDFVVNMKTEKKSTFWGQMNYSYEEISPRFDDVAYKPVRRDYELGRMVPIVELTPYLSTPLTTGVNPRWGIELDLAVYGIPQVSEQSAASSFFQTVLVGAALGYDYTDDLFNATNYSHGPLMKLMFDIKNTDIGFCLYAKYKWNYENDHHFESVPFGARVSFSRDFFSLFVGIGNEPRYTDKTENVVTVYMGMTLYFPVGMSVFD